jgi:hypothetical protein
VGEVVTDNDFIGCRLINRRDDITGKVVVLPFKGIQPSGLHCSMRISLRVTAHLAVVWQ